MALFVWPPITLSSSPLRFLIDGSSVEVSTDTTDPSLSTPLPVESISRVDVIDRLDANLLDSSVVNIPQSSEPVLEVVSSLAGNVSKIRSQDDIGEYIGLYVNGALKDILGPGGSEIEMQILAGSSIGLRNMADLAISSGKIKISFLG
jgi:hypothetical protein